MKNKQKIVWAIGAFIIGMGLGLMIHNAVYAHVQEKITLCHKTHSETNPWIEQTVNANELESHLANGDFIINSDHPCPPKVVSTPSPTPSPKPCIVWEGEFPVPCPSTTPTVTPSPSPTPTEGQSGGGSGNVPSNPHTDTTEAPGAPTCNIPFTAPVLNGFSLAGTGSVTFSWLSSANSVDKFSIRYGYTKDNLVYGEDNIPSSSRSITINDLKSGSSVWAIVTAWHNGCAEDSNAFDPRVK